MAVKGDGRMFTWYRVLSRSYFHVPILLVYLMGLGFGPLTRFDGHMTVS